MKRQIECVVCFDIYQSEDVSFLKKELNQGEKDLERIGNLCKECIGRAWSKESILSSYKALPVVESPRENLVRSQSNVDFPTSRPLSCESFKIENFEKRERRKWKLWFFNKKKERERNLIESKIVLSFVAPNFGCFDSKNLENKIRFVSAPTTRRKSSLNVQRKVSSRQEKSSVFQRNEKKRFSLTSCFFFLATKKTIDAHQNNFLVTNAGQMTYCGTRFVPRSNSFFIEKIWEKLFRFFFESWKIERWRNKNLFNEK